MRCKGLIWYLIVGRKSPRCELSAAGGGSEQLRDYHVDGMVRVLREMRIIRIIISTEEHGP